MHRLISWVNKPTFTPLLHSTAFFIVLSCRGMGEIVEVYILMLGRCLAGLEHVMR